MVIKAIWTPPTLPFGNILGWRLRYEKWSNYCVASLDDDLKKLEVKEIFLDGPDKNEYTVQDLGETKSSSSSFSSC